MTGDTMTTEEAAAALGITTSGVRQLARRGRLVPIRRHAHPMRFWTADVRARAGRMMTPADHAALDAAWQEVQHGG